MPVLLSDLAQSDYGNTNVAFFLIFGLSGRLLERIFWEIVTQWPVAELLLIGETSTYEKNLPQNILK